MKDNLVKDLQQNINKNFHEMVLTQLNSWELTLRKRELKETTIDRKIRNVIGFYAHLNTVKALEKVKVDNISQIAFEYVRDGYFSEDNFDNEGTYGYRRNIYSNIREGMNYIYEDLNSNKKLVIDELTDEQKVILEDLSKNKFFKAMTTKDGYDYYSIQTKIIEDLGIKVYFDDSNKPYVYSHELAELIGKEAKIVMRDIRKILDKINEYKIVPVENKVDFTMVEGIYVDTKGEKRPTYKLYKDLLINYILGLNGEKYFEFKVKYQGAFNYIEEEFNRQLQENAKLKEEFLNMYNQIRKRNRDLLIGDHNKKCKENSKKAV